MRAHLRKLGPRAGTSLIELSLTFTILVVVLLATFTLMHRDAELSRSTLGIQVAEIKAERMLYQLQRELADARGANPIASLTTEVTAGEAALLEVDDTLGFPPAGTLLLDRGTVTEERIDYTALGNGNRTFLTLERGAHCTEANGHASGSDTVIWSGLAEPIEEQDSPAADTFDGCVQLGTGQQVFFRGDGTGFSFRVPTDPDHVNGTMPDYLDGDQLQWGATVNGAPTLSGWSCLYFAPRFTYDEAVSGNDINEDGDANDVFDVGQIRLMTWDTSDPTVAPDDLGLGPSVVLQERCNRGGDLDSDGFEDPIFLWDKDRRQLHIRLFVLGHSAQSVPIVRVVETSVFLRNEASN